jgi:KDO2-lipid IV(A) lauroyltransferase
MMTFNGMDHVDRLLGQGRSIAAYFSHTFNWEWVPSITLWSATKQAGESEFCQVYRPLRDPWFDRYMLKLRGRFNPLSCPKSTVLRDLIKLRRQGIPSITGFMSDQKPSHGDPTRVLMFLNHPTAFITGTETLARKMKMAAVYFDMRKTSRGHYRIDIIPLTDDASTLPEMELTDTYARMLEATIRRDPSLWLWTHKRWKHPVEMPQSPTPPTSNGK